jgi:excinuclease ABC subunit B
MANLPAGTVTFLFTDIEESTRLWERHPEAMKVALRRHNDIVQAAIEGHTGYIFKTMGDAFCAAFASAPEALSAAVEVQRSLHAEPWDGVEIRVRIGLHTGEAETQGDDYVGPTLNRVARLMDAGHGGQILVSGMTHDLIYDRLPPQVALHDLGERLLKDLVHPEHVYQVAADDLPTTFLPIRAPVYRPPARAHVQSNTSDEHRFQLDAPFQPTGDQPQAIKELTAGIEAGYRHQVLKGATGTGKTFTMAHVIANVQKPTLILAHNKTLAAQLYSEFKELFPQNCVEYFVSYYDYYQPEAYVVQHDLYIEKDADINDEIERLRLAATSAVLTRRDTIIVASVSAIYALGNPHEWGKVILPLEVGQAVRRETVMRHLVSIYYDRNDLDFRRGTFRARGDVVEIRPAYSETAYRISFWGDEIESLTEVDPLTGEVLMRPQSVKIFPAKHYVTPADRMGEAIETIEAELEERLDELNSEGKLLEAQRLEQRTRYDLEMVREIGYCSGIENYSRHFDQRDPGEPPWTLLDYFPSDFLLIVDESHMSVPQVRGMYNGDRSRKQTLVDFGFRLPSALDNRPLTFAEFEERLNQVVYTTATPSDYELAHADQVVEQVIRPTGIMDPEIIIRPTEGQVDDLVGRIRDRVDKGQRVLVTTLTKRMSEDLADYLRELGIKVTYLHSEIQTIERVEILRDLRLGQYDVVVGINLLREGLDLPEVSLVAILDADKQGFLRSATALIQTMGRAARHLEGTVVMYADTVTDAMQAAIEETTHRREKQRAYNEEHGIEPTSIVKEIRDITDRVRAETQEAAERDLKPEQLEPAALDKLIRELEKQMKAAADNWEFEKAAALRDQIFELRGILEDKAPLWKRDQGG